MRRGFFDFSTTAFPPFVVTSKPGIFVPAIFTTPAPPPVAPERVVKGRVLLQDAEAAVAGLVPGHITSPIVSTAGSTSAVSQ